jgi:hypothetical protein
MINGTQIAKRVRNSEAHRASRLAMMLGPHDAAPRHVCRDNVTLLWPERAIGRDPAINLAEVEAALLRPQPPRAAPQTRRPADIGEPPTVNGKNLTYTRAAAMRGVSAAAMFKRVHRYGWSVAMNDLIKAKMGNSC